MNKEWMDREKMTAHSNTTYIYTFVARYKQTTYANQMRAIKQQPHNLQTVKHECFITLECISIWSFRFYYSYKLRFVPLQKFSIHKHTSGGLKLFSLLSIFWLVQSAPLSHCHLHTHHTSLFIFILLLYYCVLLSFTVLWFPKVLSQYIKYCTLCI